MNKPDKFDESQYVHMDQRTHVLARPDTYIGSVETYQTEFYLVAEDKKSFEKKQVYFCPGLYKLFDEILVNAIDESSKAPVKKIKVNIDTETGTITVFNDGSGIPIEYHNKHKMYIPELIFGNLLSGSNYDDKQERIVGGKNGLGAKLANIYSSFFQVETVYNEKKYVQEWTGNMTKKSEPKITSKKTGGTYTKITFTPEYSRFHKDLEPKNKKAPFTDFVRILERRCYDASACTAKSVSLYFQDKVIVPKTFDSYVNLYLSNYPGAKKVYEGNLDTPDAKKDGRIWEVAATLNTDPSSEFEQTSFVNGIWTIRGGKHVEYITSQIISKLTTALKSKKGTSSDLTISPGFIRNRLKVYVRSTIVNPSFESQSKEVMSTQSKNFGSKFELSSKFINALSKFEVIKEIIEDASAKEERKLHKSSDAKKSARILGIPKYTHAHWAGTKRSAECTLLLVEGDSAKSFADTGLSVIGHEKYGIFPLRGKLINVREATKSQLENNQELIYLKKILGLSVDREYTSKKELNYGSVMILTDADDDGHHIKGLVINFFETWWPSLTRLPGFIKSMRTPVVIAKPLAASKKSQPPLEFFSYTEFKNWSNTVNNDGDDSTSSSKYQVTYYKGLGTSENKEIIRYFKRLEELTTDFTFGSKKDSESLELAFSKSHVSKRKQWLQDYNPAEFDERINRQRQIDVWTFIHKIMIQFSWADVRRSLGSICDGLKTSQRKVLFTCIDNNITRPQKVSELGGIVSAKTAYHHGDTSMTGTIVGMAQDFWASNNIAFLYGKGNFGNRKESDNASSARYISSFLNPVSKALFHKDDLPLLNYLEEDNKNIEPDFYLPVLPTVLVNGLDGIGTGFSCQIPKYNPLDICTLLRKLISGKGVQTFELVPWFRHFKGSIELTDRQKGQYTSKGVVTKVNRNTIRITELPIGKFGTWTEPYKTFIESCVVGYAEAVKNAPASASKRGGSASKKVPANPDEFLSGFLDNSTDKIVDIELEFEDPEYLAQLLESGEIYKKLKLVDTINTSNMHLFDLNGKIRKYTSPEEILVDFYSVRLEYYNKRKQYMLKKYKEELAILHSRVRFVEEILYGYDHLSPKDVQTDDQIKSAKGIVIFRKKRKEIERILELRDYYYTKEQTKKIVSESDSTEESSSSGRYNYLLSIQIHTFSEEKISELHKERNFKQYQLDVLRAKPVKEIWTDDLDYFEQEYAKYLALEK